jgi:hypothetical protein
MHKEKRPFLERGRPHSSLVDGREVVTKYSQRYNDQHLFQSKEHEILDLNNLEFIQKLYVDNVDGEVWKVYDTHKKEYIHLKMISLKPEIDIKEERQFEDLEIELKIYDRIKREQHPNICDLRDVSDTLFDDTDRVIYIKTQGGLCCLYDMFETRVNGLSKDTDFPYTEKEIMMIARQVSYFPKG